MNIRAAILDSLPDARMIPLAEVHQALAEFDRNAVDCALRGLVRAGTLTAQLGYIGRPGATLVGSVAPPVRAQEETMVESLECKTCGETKPAAEMVTYRGKPIHQCKPCRAANGRQNGDKRPTPESTKTLAAVVRRHAKPGRKPGVPAAAVAATIARSQPSSLALALEQLRAQRAKLDQAIAALEAL